MDDNSKKRTKDSRAKKLIDDKFNRQASFTKKIAHAKIKVNERVKEIRHGAEESFFDRLRRTDHEHESNKKQHNIDMRAQRSLLASYKDGVCMLNNFNIEDQAKKDEKRAMYTQKKKFKEIEKKDKA